MQEWNSEMLAEMRWCGACPRAEERNAVAAPRGQHGKYPFILLGESPSREEDELGQTFCGPSGKLLDEMLVESGIDPAGAYISNTAKCATRTPTRAEAETCGKKWLLREVAALKPKALVCLGRTAHDWATGSTTFTAHGGMTSPRTELKELGVDTAVYLTHPAYVIRGGMLSELWVAGAKRLFGYLIEREARGA